VLRKLLSRLAPAGRKVKSAPAHSARQAADRAISEGNEAERSGDWHQACEHYRRAVAAAPGYARAHLNLGVALEAIDRPQEAIAAYQAALAADPSDAYAHYNLGKLLFVRGALDPARKHLHDALKHRSDFPEAQVVLAHVLDARGEAAEAATAFEIALRHRLEDFGGWLAYGQLLRRLGRDADAQAALQRAASLEPGNADAHAALADLYQTRGEHSAAALHLEAVLKQRPDWVDALCNYGSALVKMHRLDEADAAFARAIAIRPGHMLAYRLRANVLHRSGRIGEYLQMCRAGRAHNPDSFELESFELLALNFVDDISAEDHFKRHRAFGERLERAFPARFAPFRNDRDPGRRLRVGFISGEFSYHPVSLFLIPLFERRDRSMFEVTCYSVADVTDAVTRQLMAAADRWRDARAMTEIELADAVHRDGIDILVDLAGHSGISRLGVFAQQPAPIQATWLGYLNTTGLTRMQYRISDAYCDPPGLSDRCHTESLVRLPRSQWCYRPLVQTETTGAAPVETNGHVTFGSFVQIAKLEAPMRALWARILRQVPNSRLVVAGTPAGRARDELLAALAGHGIASSRVALLPFMPMRDYFRSFDTVDIALDTSPYSGGTTTCDALWMGVPVLSLPGTRPVSRSAASILASVGLGDWIASSSDDYVQRAVRFAGESATIAGLRRTLRERLRASPLMDEARFALDMEQALRGLWRTWCTTEQSPASVA
jgi:protein O-GlcNAc transferase